MSENNENSQYLPIAEDFFSIQGEGITTGKPAYFVRLKDCNLTCGASRNFVKTIKDGTADSIVPGSFQGDLHKDGKATWTCDTIPVWLFGEKKPFSYLLDKWNKYKNIDDTNLLDWILTDRVNIIWTGGEPLLPRSQKCIAAFMDYFVMKYDKKPYCEIETNGTQIISDDMKEYMSQINCSAKLSNSGLAKEARIVPEAIASILSHWNSWFKFVISTEADIEEIIEDYVIPHNIPIQQVICMPGLDDRVNFFERTQFVLEMAKKYGFIGLTRLHVAAWDKTTGV